MNHTTETSEALTTRTVMVPLSGESLSLDAESDVLAEALYRIRDYENQLRSLKATLSEEISQRMDKEALYTLRVGDFEVTGQSPERTLWDADKLSVALSDLLAADLISQDAADRALESVVTQKPRVAGIKALLKRGGEIAERIEACSEPDPRPRRVSVKPKELVR